jgi:hypothetical protein
MTDILSSAPPCDQLHVYEQFVDQNWLGGSRDYTMIALAGEIGEACNWHKKGLRQPGFGHDPDWKKKKIDELGDALYYLARAAHEEGTTLRGLMAQNHTKLKKRGLKDVPGS